jgi:hypothetical protein
MRFRRLADALLFHSSQRVTTDYEAARLERAREDVKWLVYDTPTWMRRTSKVIRNERRQAAA